MKKIAVICTVMFVGALGLLGWGLHGMYKEFQARQDLEHQTAVEPAIRTIPLEEGNLYYCYSFPIRQYDNRLAHCVACQLQKMEEARPQQPFTLSCMGR